MNIRTLLLYVILPSSLLVSSCRKKDQTPPVLTLNGEPTVTIFVGDTYADPKATAQDDRDGDISGDVRVEGLISPLKAGEYIVTYKVADDAGNEAIPVSRKVLVKHKNTFIAGDYTASEACNFGNVDPYDASITASPDDLISVTLKNFGNYNTTIDLTAALSGETNQTITLTANQVNAGIVYNGSGTVSADGRVITINYSASQGSTQDQCTATWTRK